jgi:hypothetical protein
VALYQIPLNPNSQRSNSSVVVLHQRISLHCACVRRPAGRRAVAEARRAQQYNSEGAEFGCVARARRGSQACAAHPRRHGRLLFGGCNQASPPQGLRPPFRPFAIPRPPRWQLGTSAAVVGRPAPTTPISWRASPLRRPRRTVRNSSPTRPSPIPSSCDSVPASVLWAICARAIPTARSLRECYSGRPPTDRRAPSHRIRRYFLNFTSLILGKHNVMPWLG